LAASGLWCRRAAAAATAAALPLPLATLTLTGLALPPSLRAAPAGCRAQAGRRG
jgi:hypothetical protein